MSAFINLVGLPLALSYLLVGLLSAYLALYPMLFTYLVQRFQVQSAVIFAAIWTLTEFLRGWVFTGFPWLQFGYTQIDSPFFGIAPIFGVNGADILYCLGKCGHFLILFLHYRKKQWNLVRCECIAIIGCGWIKCLCR